MIEYIQNNKVITTLLCSTLVIAIVLATGFISNMIRRLTVKNCTLSFGSRFAQFVDNRLTFLGVIHHELSHAIFAILTGAKIVQCKLFEVKNNTLGHVDIQTRGGLVLQSIQNTFCGMAPIVCGSISLYSIYHFLLQKSTKISVVTVILVILAMHIGYHMAMSKQDLKVAIRGMPVVYILLSVIMYFTGLDFNFVIEFLKVAISVILLNLIVANLVGIIYRIKR